MDQRIYELKSTDHFNVHCRVPCSDVTYREEEQCVTRDREECSEVVSSQCETVEREVCDTVREDHK